MSDDLPKLVRDRIPEIIRDDGDEPEIREVSGEEYQDFLLEKIVEESGELLESRETEELADLMEAVDAYMESRDISDRELEQLRHEKNSERGGFSEGYVLEDY